MDLDAASSATALDMDEMEVSTGTFYRAKCGAHHRRLRRRQQSLVKTGAGVGADESGNDFAKQPGAGPLDCFVPEEDLMGMSDDDDDEEDEIVGLQLPPTLADVPPSHLKCNCFNPHCKLKRFFRFKSKQLAAAGNVNGGSSNAAAATSSSQSSSIDSSSSAYLRLLSDHAEVNQAQLALRAEAGGEEAANHVYDCCLSLYRQQSKLLSTTASEEGDTVLMLLCSRKSDRLLLGQIHAFIRLHLEHSPELLFVRNEQGTNALELAGLTNKTSVASYLALLYGALGRDVNETNSQGHTVLHLLARKGDESADTLERLLQMKRRPASSSSLAAPERLLHIDVVNSGGKTPLDVAVTCADMFSTGRDRTIYTRVIELFHQVVEDEARALLASTSISASANDASNRFDRLDEADEEEEEEEMMTFRNF